MFSETFLMETMQEILDEPYITSTGNRVAMNEQSAQKQLAPAMEVAGIPVESWPLDREGAAELLRWGGYAVTGEELARLGKMKQVPDVEMFDARDVLAAAGALNARRQWTLTPSVKDHEKHETRLIYERCLRGGEEGLKRLEQALSMIDLRYALILLAESDSREFREKLLSTVHALLGLEADKFL